MEHKPFWKTSEFWLILGTGLAALVTAPVTLPAAVTVAAIAVSTGAYAIGRSIIKSNAPTSPVAEDKKP